MSPLRPSGVGIVLAAAALSGGLAVHDQVGWLEWFFLTVLLGALGLALRQGVRAWRQAVVERQRVVRLSSTEPHAVAVAAVREERHRLSEDIVGCLRQTLLAVDAEVPTTLAAPDPVPGIQRIRHHTQVATSELRRQLGLLRTPQSAATDVSPPPVSQGRIRSLAGRDFVVAALAVTVAAIESVVYSRLEGFELSWVSFLLTVLAASTIIGRRIAPGAAAFACGGVFLVAIVLGAPVEGGFWGLIAVCGLLWTIASRVGSSWLGLAGGSFLMVIGTIQSWMLSRSNMSIGLVMAGVAICGGLVVRMARHLAGSSHALADMRETQLRSAAAVAVSAERQTFARELHDVVSHAVGLIAVQSGAAEVAWPADPAATRESLRLISETARSALAELNRLSPDLPISTRTLKDLHALVERIRSAGTSVELQADLDPEVVLRPEVFRTVQEGLTNVVRHAPGATAWVRITTDEHETVVVVFDDGMVDAPSSHRGYGLVGLAERVAFAGGVLETGPGPEGRGFRVTATLPSRVGLVA
ncbi:MAG TPA: histidine kinase [Microlunatus sp.]